MARKILLQAEPFNDSFKLTIPSEYNRLIIKDLVRNQKVRWFELTARIRSSRSQRGYLEGAIVPVYCYWQYGIDPRQPNEEKVRDLFKLDFWYEIVKKRSGEPEKVMLSWRKQQAEVLDKYTAWAQENGAPVPNEKLYKLWRDTYSMDTRWVHYWDWLDFLGLEHDAMPSAETINQKLNPKKND